MSVGQKRVVALRPPETVNEAYERFAKSDVKYCFSIDMASLKSEQPSAGLITRLTATKSSCRCFPGNNNPLERP
jgi:hypothetical protein